MQQTGLNLATILVTLVLCGAFRCEAAEPSEEIIARGKALVVAGDCASCHTADPAKPFAGGRRIATPFGGVYSANLTPDRETGIGDWDDADFLEAFRHGIAPDGSYYYPAFPYPYFTKLIRDDILAIRAYLGTLDPVQKEAPPPDLFFPFNFRVVMRLWNWMFFEPGIIMPDQSKGTEWNRGRYLVEGLGHCGSCHTPKNWLGADKSGQTLAGGRVDGVSAPSLDNADGSAMKSWTVDDLTDYLRNGRNSRGQAGPIMSAVVADSTSKMSDGDVRAMAVYLKSLPAR
ncbi:MAG: c-type cytochrome [Bradyrhizobium sp.]|nr:c-type cytochrome [Bradyrhizobium sp.]